QRQLLRRDDRRLHRVPLGRRGLDDARPAVRDRRLDLGAAAAPLNRNALAESQPFLFSRSPEGRAAPPPSAKPTWPPSPAARGLRRGSAFRLALDHNPRASV